MRDVNVTPLFPDEVMEKESVVQSPMASALVVDAAAATVVPTSGAAILKVYYCNLNMNNRV